MMLSFALRRSCSLRPVGVRLLQQQHALKGSASLDQSLACRMMATSPLEVASKMYDDLVAKSVEVYKSNQKAVADDLDAELAKNKMVLFMEGSPDAPKSEPSLML